MKKTKKIIKKPSIKGLKLKGKGRRRALARIRQKVRIKDPFGNVIILKRLVTSILGLASYRRLNIINKTKIEGIEHLEKLPKTNVLFISNHQTYYAEVFALYHIFCGVKWKLKNINLPIYLLFPRAKSYYIAAEETMKESGLLPKIFSYAGAVTVKRSWRYKGENVDRGADFRAPDKIKKALDFGWVVTFPTGTTRAEAPIQKGAVSIIKALNPLVVPVQINGFNQAFDRKGLSIRKKGTQLSVKFGAPRQFDGNVSQEEIKAFLEQSILS